MKTILVPVDFSDVTSAVIQAARKYAAASKSRLLLLHVAEPDLQPAFVGFEPGPLVEPTALLRDTRTDMKKLQGTARQLTAEGIDVVIREMHGMPADTILEEASREDADLIILGSHGHGRLYHLLAGSVTAGVLRGASCPVMVVPSGRS